MDEWKPGARGRGTWNAVVRAVTWCGGADGVDWFAVLDDACPPALVGALLEDAERYDFVPPGPNGGGEFAMGAITNPAPAAFAALLRPLVGVDFTANEVSYQRYDGADSGLRVHRDQRFYARCIAIATLRGSARFGIHGDEPTRSLVVEWDTKPGQVILLRGWARGDTDPRPFHRVDPPTTGDRLMVQLRMNLLAIDPPPPEVVSLSDREIEEGRYAAGFAEAQRLQNGRWTSEEPFG